MGPEFSQLSWIGNLPLPNILNNPLRDPLKVLNPTTAGRSEEEGEKGGKMAEQHPEFPPGSAATPHDQQHQLQSQAQQPPGSPPEDAMASCVAAMEAALLPCLPARELQAIDRSAHSSHQIDVERHARDFMEAAKKLQLYFVGLQHEDQPTREEVLKKEIAMLEEELKTKSELIKKHEALIQRWRKELKDQLDKHNAELERV
ncbi:hypothetical protein Taro_009737 [Colocasia esculenta]|uniref:Mediator of RNA polymerase II transcription subunit 28 n=1 Tax=Colocasia esculenta TaxID=4460 RepID=A0A843U7D6_COLES|nr:hypothetical protein [Colocasia esculenta]